VVMAGGFVTAVIMIGTILKFQPTALLRLVTIKYYAYDVAAILRLTFWRGMLESFLAHPFTGIGLGNFVHQPFSYSFIGAHNVFFNAMGETGILGIVGLLGLMLVLFIKLFRVWKTARRTSSVTESICLIGSWSTVVVHGVFDNVWSVGSHTREIKYIWFFLALTLVFIQNELRPETGELRRSRVA